ncbi:MAG: cytochrome c [Gammaproteobacteria bacterium]|nr:cytochrome c [Gammaproteobacteria bacterium]
MPGSLSFIKHGIIPFVAISVLALISSCGESLPGFSFKQTSGLSQRNAVSLEASNVDAFVQTLYPVLRSNCAACHDSQGPTPNTPFFADVDTNVALGEALQRVDLIDPVNSRIVQKLVLESHNCWSGNCLADASVLQAAIEQWAGLANVGQVAFIQQCASCHGANGQGVNGTIGLTRPLPLAELTTFIENNMPPANPAACVGVCAADLAQFIFNNFNASNSGVVQDPLATLPESKAQLDLLCARLAAQNAQNVVRDAFCGAVPPAITSLRDLQAALGLAFTNPNAAGRRNNGRGGNPAFTLVGHSSSLVARFTNPINPRALIFTPPNGRNQTPGLIAMGFVRGDQFAELVVSDRVTNDLQFFLFTFKQQCNLTNSCAIGELLTPAVERNWVDYTIYGQVDLANTVFDCLQCHQTGGPGTPSILRMQELANPWNHFLRNNRQGGQVLLNAFTAAHGTNEDYAGIPAALIPASDPALLEDLVRGNGFGNQPNAFNSGLIENQVNQTPGQPADNTTPGTSAEWQRIYNNTVLGQFIAVPYHDILVTDPAQLQSATQAYQNFLGGALTAAALPDIRNIFMTSALRDIGFRVMAGLDGQQIITQACTQCHNSQLDQTITRARFNVDLNAMSDTLGGVLTGAARDAELGLAIARLQLPENDVRRMPPALFKTLDATEIAAATSYLCSQMTTPGAQCVNAQAFTPNPAPLPAAGPPPGGGGGGGGGFRGGGD